MKSSGLRLFAAVALLSALTACGGTSEKEAEPEADPTTSSTAESSPHPDAPEVTLLDAGDEPREKLRLDLEPGDTSHATMTMTTTMEMSLGGQSSGKVATPPISMGMEIEVTDVREDGIIESEFSYDELDVEGDGAQAEQIEKVMQGVVGITGSMESTDTGALVGGDMDLPDDLDPTIKQTMSSFESQMRNLTVPLPTEAVGVGAEWETTVETELNGIKGSNKVRYRFVERDGDRIVLELTLEQTAPEQDPAIPGLPAGSSVHLEKMRMTGTGRTVVALDSLMPVSAKSGIEGSVSMTVEEDGKTTDMVQDMQMEMELAED